mmetsp:Transcript_41310/g.127636  ORF Transcript_41310/g.127636 Transcript_41310/m.127636 type:complete len:213 (+) Transcript_41310:1488-2126(+)
MATVALAGLRSNSSFRIISHRGASRPLRSCPARHTCIRAVPLLRRRKSLTVTDANSGRLEITGTSDAPSVPGADDWSTNVAPTLTSVVFSITVCAGVVGCGGSTTVVEGRSGETAGDKRECTALTSVMLRVCDRRFAAAGGLEAAPASTVGAAVGVSGDGDCAAIGVAASEGAVVVEPGVHNVEGVPGGSAFVVGATRFVGAAGCVISRLER